MYRGLSPHSADHVFRTAGAQIPDECNLGYKFGDRGPPGTL